MMMKGLMIPSRINNNRRLFYAHTTGIVGEHAGNYGLLPF
jgi:hypothetical protein